MNQHIGFAPPLPVLPNHPQLQRTTPPKKQRRVSRACDFCHKRSIRCKPSEEAPGQCQNCFDFAVPCSYHRPVKKRGIKSGNAKLGQPNRLQHEDSDGKRLLELQSFNVGGRTSIPGKWRSMALNEMTLIRNLVDVYFQVVYPIFPWFHAPSMRSRVVNQDYLTDHSFFADTMAICALASARVRDGALFPGQWEPAQFQSPITPEVFFSAAKEAMPQDMGVMRGLDWMRTCALMALYGIQVNELDIMHQYLGMYHSLMAMDNLHDEKNWPRVIGVVERELRRRLFWSMYSLEVYVAIVWGGTIRCREAQSRVVYPSEVDDELFSDTVYSPDMPAGTQATDANCWLHGLNFCTAFYRVLEHAMDDFHNRRLDQVRLSPNELFKREVPQPDVVLGKVMTMFGNLPQHFKDTTLSPPYSQGAQHKFSFQAANIAATLQLVRMVLFSSKEATVDEKCTIAQDLLQSFERIPLAFLRAISSPLLHHIVGIGAILLSAIKIPMEEGPYLQVRGVLLQMADLLSKLETGMNPNVGAASRIRDYIQGIDNSMMPALPHGDQTHTPQLSIPPPTPISNIVKEESGIATGSNIDPSLQTGPVFPHIGPATMNGYQQQPDLFQYSNVAIPMTTTTIASAIPVDGHILLPPEFMNFPWSADLGSGFMPPPPDSGF